MIEWGGGLITLCSFSGYFLPNINIENIKKKLGDDWQGFYMLCLKVFLAMGKKSYETDIGGSNLQFTLLMISKKKS